ncbi:SAM-dependent methyltransferase [Pseudofrankia sp. DC12]|uniref:SAM-dependent methyltransferase n=1 Tax=Pseudofrankia sp. DC12 TaxID=683315 RepID=UPI000A8C8EE6
MYDYYPGGETNYPADREAAEQVLATFPSAGITARQNRAFLGRATRYLAEAGIGQFLDVGAGIPTSPNLHEVAQAATPSARVIYVDNDCCKSGCTHRPSSHGRPQPPRPPTRRRVAPTRTQTPGSPRLQPACYSKRAFSGRCCLGGVVWLGLGGRPPWPGLERIHASNVDRRQRGRSGTGSSSGGGSRPWCR